MASRQHEYDLQHLELVHQPASLQAMKHLVLPDGSSQPI